MLLYVLPEDADPGSLGFWAKAGWNSKNASKKTQIFFMAKGIETNKYTDNPHLCSQNQGLAKIFILTRPSF